MLNRPYPARVRGVVDGARSSPAFTELPEAPTGTNCACRRGVYRRPLKLWVDAGGFLPPNGNFGFPAPQVSITSEPRGDPRLLSTHGHWFSLPRAGVPSLHALPSTLSVKGFYATSWKNPSILPRSVDGNRTRAVPGLKDRSPLSSRATTL